MLRCSVGNSKSQLHKAKLKIRELLMLEKDGSVRPETDVEVKKGKPSAGKKVSFDEETNFLAAMPHAAQSDWAMVEQRG